MHLHSLYITTKSVIAEGTLQNWNKNESGIYTNATEITEETILHNLREHTETHITPRILQSLTSNSQILLRTTFYWDLFVYLTGLWQWDDLNVIEWSGWMTNSVRLSYNSEDLWCLGSLTQHNIIADNLPESSCIFWTEWPLNYVDWCDSCLAAKSWWPIYLVSATEKAYLSHGSSIESGIVL